MPQPRRSYTPTEVDTALLTLILSGRNSGVAARRLQESAGITVDPRTLRNWRDKVHADRYAELEREHAPKIEQQMMSQARAIVTAANAVTLEAIEASHEQLRNGEAKDPSTVARNLATASGIATDKALLLSGRPTEITASADDLQAALTRMTRFLGVEYTNGTAVEYEPSAPELEG